MEQQEAIVLFGQLVHRRTVSKRLIFYDLHCDQTADAAPTGVELVLNAFNPGMSLEYVKDCKYTLKLGDRVRAEVCGQQDNTYSVRSIQVVRAWRADHPTESFCPNPLTLHAVMHNRPAKSPGRVTAPNSCARPASEQPERPPNGTAGGPVACPTVLPATGTAQPHIPQSNGSSTSTVNNAQGDADGIEARQTTNNTQASIDGMAARDTSDIMQTNVNRVPVRDTADIMQTNVNRVPVRDTADILQTNVNRVTVRDTADIMQTDVNGIPVRDTNAPVCSVSAVGLVGDAPGTATASLGNVDTHSASSRGHCTQGQVSEVAATVRDGSCRGSDPGVGFGPASVTSSGSGSGSGPGCRDGAGNGGRGSEVDVDECSSSGEEGVGSGGNGETRQEHVGGSNEGVLTLLCKHWINTGRCNRGDKCPFLHVDNETGLREKWVTRRRQNRQQHWALLGNPHALSAHAKQHRGTVFVDWLVDTFGSALSSGSGVLDVAGGRGAVAFDLQINRGIKCVLIDPRPLKLTKMQHKCMAATGSIAAALPQQIQENFTPRLWHHHEFGAIIQDCSVVIGMHPDEATDAILDFAIAFNKPFAIVPCCVFARSFPTRRYVNDAGEVCSVSTYDHLLSYLQQRSSALTEYLNFQGLNRVVYRTKGVASA